ncbi:MAG: Hint domain-containing protein [Maritimibacter sp.]|nr:Hint domain-containing protein [Maritimibacter sp.]
MSSIDETGGRFSGPHKEVQSAPAPRVNCFTPGTLISTPRGEVPIERIGVGDTIVTRDNGVQEVRWIGRKTLSGPALRFDTRLHPVRIRAGALGPDLPARDLCVSPNHRLLLVGEHPELDAGESEVFVSAKHLLGTRGVERVEPVEVTYLHLMFDRHEVVLSEGAWTESFHPTDEALDAAGEASRDELFELFPELRDAATRRTRRAARRTLAAGEAKRLRA